MIRRRRWHSHCQGGPHNGQEDRTGQVRIRQAQDQPHGVDHQEYHGAVSGKRYVADIVVTIDSSNKDAWEVLNTDYADNNSVSSNEKKIQELIKQMNK